MAVIGPIRKVVLNSQELVNVVLIAAFAAAQLPGGTDLFQYLEKAIIRTTLQSTNPLTSHLCCPEGWNRKQNMRST